MSIFIQALFMHNPLWFLLKTMWRYSQGNRRNVVRYFALFIGANLLAALEPMIVGVFLNSLQVDGLQNSNLLHLIFLVSLLPVLEIGFWCMHGPARVTENRNAFFVRTNYKNHLLQGTMTLPIEWHTDHHSGDTIDKIEKGTNALFSFSERTFEIIQGAIVLTTAFIAMFYFDILAGGVALAISLVTFYILTLFDKRLVPGYKKVNRMENALSAKIFDALSNVTTIIILRVEALVLKTIDQFINKPFAQYNTNIKLNEWKWFSASVMGRLAVVAVVCIYLVAHASTGGILVGTIYVLYGYANQIRDTFFKFAYLYNDIVRYRASVSNTEELSKDFSRAAISASRHLPRAWSRLAIKDLSFSYHTEEGADLHLEDIAMEVKKGARIALIGASGGGKSTLLKIMRDLYHPRTLSLVLDGKETGGGFSAISDSISLIPQDPEVFATTIRENITLGVEYPEGQLRVFSDMARFTSVVGRLPKGLESSIVEKGVNLSGGEKQRLALTRGLLASRDKDIILLDEPTSSVDFHNELEIYQNIFEGFPQKTIISSIHRLHLLSLFDTVYLLKNGRVAASGTFTQLKRTSPDFKKLWQKYIRTRDAHTKPKKV